MDSIAASQHVRNNKVVISPSRDATAGVNAAADERNQSQSQFTRESTLKRADEILADRQRFTLNTARGAPSLAALEAPTPGDSTARALVPRSTRLREPG
jgi:uncharacterized protein (DUF1778 family)